MRSTDTDIINIVIIDDSLKKNDPLIEEIEDLNKNYIVELFSNAEKSLEFIKNNITTKIVVILDIDLGDKKSGSDVITDIRKLSKLIPVIIWSVFDGSNKDFTNFITNNAFSYVNQNEDMEVILEHIKSATLSLDISISAAAENWLQNNYEKKDTVIHQDKAGNSYTVNNIIEEIRQQTPFGLEIQRKLTNMTVGLFLYDRTEDKE